MNLAHDKKTFAPVGKLLRRQAGFIPNSDQVRQVHQQLMELPDAGSLEFAIYVTARTVRLPSRIVTGLSDEIWKKYRDVSQFPDIEYLTWPDVRNWLVDRFSKADRDQKSSSTFARSMLGSLLRLRDRDFYASSLLLLADQLAGASRKMVDPETNQIEVLLTELLSRPKLNRKAAAILSRCGKAMRTGMDVALDQQRQATARAESLKREVEVRQSECDVKDEQLREQSTVIDSLKAELISANDKISVARDQLAGTEEHWNVILKQKLSGLIAKLRSDIGHETREIVLCLDRSSPNSAMALERARQIDTILERVNTKT